MPGKQKVKSNGVEHNSSINNLEDAIQSLKIQANEKQDSDTVANHGPYPCRPGESHCIYYMRTGLCGYGSNCKFNHSTFPVQECEYSSKLPQRAGQPNCGYYLKTGTCKFGSACKYHHPWDKHGVGPVLLNSFGLPMRQEEKTCHSYLKNGSCKFGATCKFDHPHIVSAGTALSVPPPDAFGSSGLSVVPSSGLHYMGGASTIPFPRTPYFSSSSLQVLPSCMPVVTSSPQGIAPGYSWDTYMGDMRPVSFTSVYRSDLVYNSKNHGESGSNGMLHLLPNRPDQPECQQFLSNGSCKYESDHPRERITQLATNYLGPLGLPFRPGLPVCSYYSLYGLCKYGPTCKFDHPMEGYPCGQHLTYHTVVQMPLPKSSKSPDQKKKTEAKSNYVRNQNTDSET